MTRSRILTLALIVVLAVLAVAAWLMFGRTAAGMEYANADRYTVGGTTVTGPVENLYVDWTSGQVNIEYHAGDGVVVTETANRPLADDDRLRWWLDGTTLRIRYAKSGFRISFNLDKQLTVSLPEGTVLKSADLGTTSGDLNIPALAAEKIRLDSTSGSINAGTAAKNLSASSTSGNVIVRQDSDLETVDLRSTSGSIVANLAAVKSVTADSTSGDILLAVTGSAEKVKLHSTSGNISPELASAAIAEFSSTSGRVSGSIAAFDDLKIWTTSGNVFMDLPGDPGFTCKIDTASGAFSSSVALAKNGDVYTCGDGKARCAIDTSSGDIFIGREQ